VEPCKTNSVAAEVAVRTYHFRLTLGLLNEFEMLQSEMNFCSAVCLLLSSACPVITVLFVLYRNIVFSFGICCLPLVLTLFSVTIIVISDFNIINVIQELLNVKYNFCSMPVLDLADVVFSIESLCLNSHFYFY